MTAATALAASSACSTRGGNGQPTKTVYQTVPAHRSSAHSGTGTSGSTAPAPSSSTPATTILPGSCDNLLPMSAVEGALGRAIAGRTAFVVGVPEKDIGRISYLNCRYGLPADAKGAAKVEIGVSLYQSAALAAKRIPATIDDYVTNHGAQQKPATVGGKPATVLTGGTGSGYDIPTIVLSSGQRTIAVSVAEAAGADPTKDLVAVATLTLTKTGG